LPSKNYQKAAVLSRFYEAMLSNTATRPEISDALTAECFDSGDALIAGMPKMLKI
jgi:hypothetical protein